MCGPSAGTAPLRRFAMGRRPHEGGSAMEGRSAPEIKFDLIASENRAPEQARVAMLESPGFGRVFTDHMITLRWSVDQGWHDGKLEPYGPLSLDPATAVLHYSQE